MIARALALALGVMKTTDLVKEIFTRSTGLIPQPYLKSTLATSLAVGAACAYEDGWRERVELGSTIAGMAAILHEGYAALSTQADSNKAVVVQKTARAAVRGTNAPGSRIPTL